MASKSPNKKAATPKLRTAEQKQRGFTFKELGFHDRKRYERWIERHHSLPESDPRYFDPATFSGSNAKAEILRVKRLDKQITNPAGKLIRKRQLLVTEQKKFSAFTFEERYRRAISFLLTGMLPPTKREKKLIGRQLRVPWKRLDQVRITKYQKQQLRRLQKHLQTDMEVPPETLPGEQGVLF